MSIYNTIPHNNKFLVNKYTRWYFNIIDNALKENRKKSKERYFEAHHILPQGIFPEYKAFNNHPWNKVLLTMKEHILCHILLFKSFSGKDRYTMYHPLKLMKRGNINTPILDLILNSNKESFILNLNKTMRAKIKCPHCEKICDRGNYSQYHGDLCKHNPASGHIWRSISEKRSKTAKERYERMKSEGIELKRKSPRHSIVTCPHCSLTGNKPNLTRYHFDNCKARIS